MELRPSSGTDFVTPRRIRRVTNRRRVALCGPKLAVAALLLLGARGATAATFNYLPTPVDVSPTVAGSWQDVDVSASVPVGATGVIVQWVNTAVGADADYGVRMKGSTDNWAFDGEAKDTNQGWLMTGLNVNRVFQVYTGNTAVKTYLVGYTMAGVKFFTNRIDKSTLTTGSWQDVSIATDTGSDTAIGAIFHVDCTAGSSVNYGLRKKGSTDNRVQILRANTMNVGIIGVDATETAQQQIAATTIDLYLVGYVTSGAVFFTNGLDKSTATLEPTYVDVDLTADVGANAANGAFVEVFPSSGTRRRTGFRPNGSGYDYYTEVSHQWALVGLDAGDIFEQKIELATQDIFVTGYSLTDSTPDFRVRSGSYSGSGLARSITGLGFQPDVVIVDGSGGGADSVIRTNTMANPNSKQIDNPAALLANQIVSLDVDGFSLGTDIDVNQNGITYYWVAFKAAPGYMKVGTYAGSAGAQNVTGVGFSPAYVIVMSPNAAAPMQRSTLMPANFCLDFLGAGYTNSILNMQSNGFGLGTHASVAVAGVTFHYVAWNRVPGQIAVGSYPGDNADGRNITGVGFWPEYVIVDRSSDVGSAGGTGVGNAPAHKPASTGVSTDLSLLFNGNLTENDNIQTLQTDGFQVGTHCRVNGNGAPPCNTPAPVNYYWMAFGPHQPITRYRSIGTATDLSNQGTITVTAGSTAVSKTGGLGWLAQNRGRGDRLTVGTDHYVIAGVTSNDTLFLASPAVASYTGGTYTIARQFTTLQGWEDCVSRSAANTCKRPADTQEYFPTTSSSLVADDRSEVGIAYKDSEFDLTADFQVVGSTTDALHTIRLTADGVNRHNGVPGAGVVLDAQLGGFSIWIEDNYVTVEWLEHVRCRTASGSVQVGSGASATTGVLIQNMLVHDFDSSGIRLRGNPNKSLTVRNSMVWGGGTIGIEGDETTDTLTIENSSVDGPGTGIHAMSSALTIRNTIVTNSGTDYTASGGSLTGSNNTSRDGTAPGANAQTGVAAASVFIAPNANLHLATGANLAVNTGLDLPGFVNDIDGQLRPAAAWDRGADERDGTTEVDLVSFQATGIDSAVELRWQTASELRNLGFNLYRSDSAEGPYTRITSSLIPGLGSSATGQSYTYRDGGLLNGRLYFYKLEDVESTGKTERHGPVSATPTAGPTDAGTGSDSGSSGTTYGEPSSVTLRELERSARHVVLELRTGGFVGTPTEGGQVRLTIPGFESASQPGEPDLPMRRVLVEQWRGGRSTSLPSWHWTRSSSPDCAPVRGVSLGSRWMRTGWFCLPKRSARKGGLSTELSRRSGRGFKGRCSRGRRRRRSFCCSP